MRSLHREGERRAGRRAAGRARQVRERGRRGGDLGALLRSKDDAYEVVLAAATTRWSGPSPRGCALVSRALDAASLAVPGRPATELEELRLIVQAAERRDADAAVAAVHAHVDAASATGSPRSRRSTHQAPDVLFGREVERARLQALLADGGVIVVRGEPGVGKSTLLEQAVADAGERRVLRATGVESESELAYAGLHALLHPALGLLDRLPEPHAHALACAFGLRAGRVEDRFLVSLATHGLLGLASEDGGVLCIVDDAQWLDRASADAIVFAGRRLEAGGVALVLASRERVVASGLPELLVRGLDAGAAAELLGEAIAPAVRDRLVAATGGNPLALLELPRVLTAEQLAGREPLADPLPVGEEVERVFLAASAASGRTRRRSRSSSPPTTRRTVRRSRWRRSRQAPIRTRSTSWRRPGSSGSKGLRVALRHPLVRSAVYGAAGSGARRRAHLALAARPRRRAPHLASRGRGRRSGPGARRGSGGVRRLTPGTAARTRRRPRRSSARRCSRRSRRSARDAWPRPRSATGTPGASSASSRCSTRRSRCSGPRSARRWACCAAISRWSAAGRREAFELFVDAAGATRAARSRVRTRDARARGGGDLVAGRDRRWRPSCTASGRGSRRPTTPGAQLLLHLLRGAARVLEHDFEPAWRICARACAWPASVGSRLGHRGGLRCRPRVRARRGACVVRARRHPPADGGKAARAAVRAQPAGHDGVLARQRAQRAGTSSRRRCGWRVTTGQERSARHASVTLAMVEAIRGREDAARAAAADALEGPDRRRGAAGVAGRVGARPARARARAADGGARAPRGGAATAGRACRTRSSRLT